MNVKDVDIALAQFRDALEEERDLKARLTAEIKAAKAQLAQTAAELKEMGVDDCSKLDDEIAKTEAVLEKSMQAIVAYIEQIEALSGDADF
jgi:septal ring factor EnvC (AmiA/AmiB activator)